MSRYAIKSNRNRIQSINQKISVSPIINMDQVMIDGLMSNTIVALETDISTKEAEIVTKTTEITGLTSDLATAQSNLTTAQSDLATAQTNYNGLLANSNATSEQLTLAEAQVLTLQGQVTVLQSDYNLALSSLNDAQTELAAKQVALDACIADLAAAQASLTTAQSDLATANTNLQTANTTILDLQDQLANSGGGGGGALEPYLTDLNDASWTYFPGQTEGASAEAEANFLDSYAYDAQNKVHSFTTKSVSVAKDAYAINNGATYIGPRWYKPATYSDGSPVMIGDSFSFTVRMENVTKDANMTNCLLALDLFEWPYINDAFSKWNLAYQRSVGFCAVLSGGSVKGFGTHVNNNTTVVNTASNTELIEAVGTVVTPGGAQNSSRPSWTINWSGNYTVRNTTTNTVYHTASTEVGQLYLGMLISTNGLATMVGGIATMKISYSIGKLK